MYDVDDWDEPADDGDDTIACPRCKADIYEDSVRCPHCGWYVTEDTHAWSHKPAWLRIFAVGAIVLVILAFLYPTILKLLAIIFANG